MELKITTNAPEVSRFMRTVFADQMPFAISLALNDTAFGIRKEQVEGMSTRFRIRRQWVLGGVRVTKRATKQDLEAHVAILPDRRFLFRFEEGGEVTPEKASRFAVPDEAKRTGAGIVSKGERPRAFDFEEAGRGPVAVTFRGKKRTFMIKRHDGSGAIFQRLGRADSGKLRTLFTFTRTADLPASLQFDLTAENVFNSTYQANFAAAWDRAIRSAR